MTTKVRLQVAAREGKPGDEVEVTDARARALVHGGAAVELDRQADPEAVPQADRDQRRARLESTNIEELRTQAAKHKIEGRSDMNKAQLIDAILNARA